MKEKIITSIKDFTRNKNHKIVFLSLLQDLKNFFLDLIFPIYCLGCGGEFEDLEPRERWICKQCLEKVNIRKEQVCPVCKKLNEGGKTHYKCRDKTFLDGLWVASSYRCKIVYNAIHKLKFDFVKDASFPLAKIIIRSVFEQESFSEFQDILMTNFSYSHEKEIYEYKNKKETDTILVPVPLHKKRYNWRGFNQSFLLSKHIAQKFKLEICEDIIEKKRNTKQQAKIKSIEERKKNVKNAFSCKNKFLAKDRNVIIVDDICTTLATLNECAKEIKKSDAKSVWGIVVAM